jgi:hypothetical protein
VSLLQWSGCSKNCWEIAIKEALRVSTKKEEAMVADSKQFEKVQVG